MTSLLKKLKRGIRNDWKYHLIHRIIENNYGHKLSRDTKSSVDKEGRPIPWFTYPALEFVTQFNLKDCSVFEWGSGNSSLYFSNKCLSVISVEHDTNWFNKQMANKNANQTIILSDEQEYPSIINRNNQCYDIIVIDGILRDECTLNSEKHLNENGVIILDNSERHSEACMLLREKGLTQIDFHGLGPINEYAWTTSIFFRKLTWKPNTIQPTIPLGGGY